MTTALKTQTLLGTLGPGTRSRPLRAAEEATDPDLWTNPECTPPAAHHRFRLHREAEVPRLLAALGAGARLSAAAAEDGDGHRPDELATLRQESRQMTAIAKVVCQAVTEVLVGLRPVQQLGRWLAPQVHEKVRQRSELHAHHRQGTGVRAGPLTFGAIRTTRIRSGVWEVSVVFSDEHRTRACAIRLQAHRRRWRVTAMELG